MSAVAIPTGSARSEASAPQLRTILLTDLCDSIQLVERIGDSAAAELFRQHDLLVLQLQQQWRGRLIDRSDGMLLLFERPIDGLGFALDYNRGLRELGRTHDIDIKARAGLHVGEVLTWRNSDEAVKVGAKPLEVEGLAKPMAARLMTLARPGQVLVSAVAEPLAQRSARELGDRGRHLLWKSHGRWRFKGLPNAQEVFEAGEPGIAPLRMPQPTPKAWRDIPLWRRPAALVAELAIVLAIGLGIWFIGRPQPAIAFNERDWVVVADLRNLTGQPVLDDSLEQAFRISLEQSRYVNVLSDLKARQTLERMRLPPDTELDRAIASEVAIRDGARAVILPTVAEIGGQVRVSAEVIDPHSQTTVYSEYADGSGAQSVLTSIDNVTAGLREKLGEAIQMIERDSKPLPEVTTENLDALRAYALGQQAYGSHRYREALQFFQRATEIDPEFALAWLGQVRSFYSQENAVKAVAALSNARDTISHLPARESLYTAAWIAEFSDPAAATGKWVELAKLYPDYMPGRGNAATWLYKDNKFDEALKHARAASIPQNPFAGLEYDTLGRAHLGLENYPEAANAFGRAHAATGGSLRRLAVTAAVQRDFDLAHQYAQKLDPNNEHAYLEKVSIAVDEARLEHARQLSHKALTVLESSDGLASRYLLLPVAVTEWLVGDRKEALEIARSAADRALAALVEGGALNADAEEDATLALAAALLAQRMGDFALGERVLAGMEQHPRLGKVRAIAEFAAVLKAEQARHGKRPDRAIELIEPFLDGQERYQTRVSLMKAHAASGNIGAAIKEARWLQRRRGLAYIELECGHCLQALNVADSNLAIWHEAELLREVGQSRKANARSAAFERIWSGKSLPDHLRM